MHRLALIDANSLLHRAYHALPPLTTRNGEQVGAVFGFTSMLLSVLQELKPTFVAVAWDSKEPTFRHQEYTQYKAHRPETDKDLINQFERAREVVSSFSIPQFEVPGYEADDIVGTLASQAANKVQSAKCKVQNLEGLETIIVTGDLDALQLIDEKTKVFSSRRGFSDTILYDIEAVKARFGLKPEQLVDYKALRGDPSDNIPGVKGVGEKTATELLQKYETLKKIYEHLNDLSARQKKLLGEGQEEAYLSKKLAKIKKDVPIKIDFNACKLASYDRQKVMQLFQVLEFRSLIGKLPGTEKGTQRGLFEGEDQGSKEDEGGIRAVDFSIDYQLVDSSDKFDELVKILKKNDEVCLDTETTSKDPRKAELVGLAVAVTPGAAAYIPRSTINNLSAGKAGQLSTINNLLQSKGIIAHNLKYDAQVLEKAGINLSLKNSFDTMLAAYLLQAGQGRLNLKELAFSHLGMVIADITKLIGSGKVQLTMDKVDVEKVKDYACADADATLQLKKKFEQELIQKDLKKLFWEIEMPLVPVLTEMEENGVLIDREFLSNLSLQLQGEIAKLEKEIFTAVGHEFNPNSSQQLEQLLFDELSLPVIKRTKTQRSTDESVLKKLRGLHPVIESLLQYREFFKIKTGFVDPLPQMVDREGRVHTTFNQTRTATGRLSSENPNLQNIPLDPEIGLRRAFIALPGSKLLVADYSQVELRIITHFSADSALTSSFEKNQDIHAATAARIFNCFIDEVTPKQRRIAKTMNFAIMYGMSAHGLSDVLGIEHIKAQQYIDEYFESYPGMKIWIEKTIKCAHEQGFVETLMGRRRLIPELSSSNSRLRWAGERMAVNMPIQGTAADLVKKAMVRVSEKLRARMILQVHDELVFEVPEGEVEEVGRIVKKEMEGVMKLRVPLKVDLKVGNNWGELKELKTQNSKLKTTT